MTSTSLRVGLTGGAAAGKSTVAAAFAEHGVPVFSADAIAHALTAPGSPLLKRIDAEFGEGVFEPDGALDRQALATRVFGDDAARRRLEALLHPPIRARLAALAAAAREPYCLLEIPLLTRDDIGPLVDRVLLVELAPALQAKRLVATRGLTPARAGEILAAQAGPEARQALADDLFVNAGAPSAIPAAVAELDAFYRTLARDRDPRRPGLRLPAR